MKRQQYGAFKVCQACGFTKFCPPLTDCTTHGICERCGSRQVRYLSSWGSTIERLARLWKAIKRR